MAKKTFPLVLDEQDIEYLRSLAAQYGVSVSAVGRWIIGKDRGVSFSLPARFTEQSTKQAETTEPAAAAPTA